MAPDDGGSSRAPVTPNNDRFGLLSYGRGHITNDDMARKTPVHLASRYRYNRPVIQFVTVCVRDRRPLLANPYSHQLLVKAWRQSIPWKVGAYVIMPDHLHLFCSPNCFPAEPLGPWVAWWKGFVSRRWTSSHELPLWQRNFWDRQLRAGDSYSRKWNYVFLNPVRAGLVTRAEEWPFAGQIESLPW